LELVAEVQLYAVIILIMIHLLTAVIYLVKCFLDRIKRGMRRMSDLSSAVESSASSIAAKTAVIGGAGLGVPSILPVMQAKLIVFSEYALTPADICQVLATLWILSQAYIAAKKFIASRKSKPTQPKKEPIRTMGGSGGGGPEEETEKDQ